MSITGLINITKDFRIMAAIIIIKVNSLLMRRKDKLNFLMRPEEGPMAEQ